MGIKLNLKLPKLRLNFKKDPEKVMRLAQEAVVTAEVLMSGKSGKAKLKAAAKALAGAIDIPWLPEAAEVALAKVLIQATYGLIKGALDGLAKNKREKMAAEG